MRLNYSKVLLSALFMVLFTGFAFAQAVLTGTVVDGDSFPIMGAEVTVVGTANATTTSDDGTFSVTVDAGEGMLEIEDVLNGTQRIPFAVANGETKNVGTVTLAGEGVSLASMVVVGKGVIDIAKDRETPVAVSTITAETIETKLGNRDLPEILRTTPSVYVSQSGGGYGDSRIAVRGFDSNNTAVLINGQPVNDMENGKVYWSNWSGLQDVASAVQIQRGLGASKLAIPSVGGTINIITKATDRKQGGFFKGTVGNDGFYKGTLSYSTGLMENGWGVTALYNYWQGDGWKQGTEGKGHTYFLSIGKQIGNHNFNFLVTGAPQEHGQVTSSYYNTSTIAEYQQYGIKYNRNFGYYNGEGLNMRKNFYHKPISSLNWDWDISDRVNLNTVLYASWGRGGGTGDLGRLDGKYFSDSRLRDPNTGMVLWDQIAASNAGQLTEFNGFSYQNQVDPVTGTYIVNDTDIQSFNPDGSNYLEGAARRNGIIRRASMNSHNWYGLLSNLNFEINNNWTFDIGFDGRSYKGFHYRRIANLLGADGYRDNNNVNLPFNVVSETYNDSPEWNVFANIDDEKKIDYYNIGYVRYLGTYGQLEYKNEKISAFVQGGVSTQGYKREDLFRYTPEQGQITDWESQLGGNIKGGMNFNINEEHNIFVNTGYNSRQPNFDAVFLNYGNDVNKDLKNEKVYAVELGYGYNSRLLDVNINLYRISWKDRFIQASGLFDTAQDGVGEDDADGNTADDINGVANLYGIEQQHQGIELDFSAEPTTKWDLFGMISYGDWKYTDDVTATYFDESQNPITIGGVAQTETLYLKDVKVADAAQFTSSAGMAYEFVKGLSADFTWNYYGRLYAQINVEDFDEADHDGSLKAPDYDLFDVGLTYRTKLAGIKFTLRGNVNNLFNTEYLSDIYDNRRASAGEDTYRGIRTGNRVQFGLGRTWNVSLRAEF